MQKHGHRKKIRNRNVFNETDIRCEYIVLNSLDKVHRENFRLNFSDNSRSCLDCGLSQIQIHIHFIPCQFVKQFQPDDEHKVQKCLF